MVGEAAETFSIQSVSKPFVFALVCEALGAAEAAARLGVDATGLPFNSIMAMELRADGTSNPLVNAGAIAATSLIPGSGAEDRWHHVRQGLSRFAGRELECDEHVYASRRPTTSATPDWRTSCAGTGVSTVIRMRPSRSTLANAHCWSVRRTSHSWAQPWPAVVSIRSQASRL
jgi:hypothetical protein